MRKFLVLGLFLLSAGFCAAQTCEGNHRYLERVFPQVTKTADIPFATVQALPTVYLNETQTVTQTLYLDVIQPTGDTLQKRPLVILAFGGAYLIGTKNDADIQAACDSLAHLGYVTASIQYRLGLNPTNSASGERAVYRSAQDYSAAVRYFKQFASVYKIDTSAIFVGGASAGSFAAMHMTYGDDDERPASSFASGGLFPAPDLGCFDCSGNNYAFSHHVRGVLNMWGAIGYLDWIQPNDPPIVSFHGNLDPLVPYSEGYPFTVGATLPYVYGSARIDERMELLGIHHQFYTYESAIHQLWGGALEETWAFGPTEFQVPILNGIRLFLYDELKPLPTMLTGADTVCTGATEWYTVPYRTGFRYCWQVQNGQVLQQNNHQIKVGWNTAGTGQVTVREFNQLDIPTDTFLLENIVVHQTPTVQITGSTAMCVGDTAQLAATGADAYQWSPAGFVSDAQNATVQAWPSQTSTFSVTGSTAEQCSASAAWTVQVHPLPIAPFITRFDSELYVPEQYQTYQWFLNGQPITGATQNTITLTQGGVYTVQVGQGLGCYALSFPFTVNQYASVEEWGQSAFSVYPNPFEEGLSVDGLSDGSYRVRILSVTGQTLAVFASTGTGGNRFLSMPNLPAGMYVLELTDASGNRQHQRIVRK